MHFFNRLTAVLLAAALAAPLAPLEARTKKGDRYLGEGRAYETKKDWDAALEAYQKALAEDPSEMVYQIAADKARFQSAQSHVDKGMKIRATGKLGEALLEFQKAYAISPASSVAAQELVLTQQMIERERRRVETTGKEAPPAERGLTPADQIRQETRDKINRMLPVPELKPLNQEPIRNLKINGQPVKVLYETIGKVAGINVLWDPEFQAPPRNSFNIDFENSTLDEALDYIGVITKTYWKPLSPNTIFVTNDNPNKRRDYAEMVAQTFYLTNVSSPQEIQEIVNAVRSIAELQRVVAFTSQNAIIVRGEADQVALASKMIHDLDKPRAEVVVDIMVMEASSVFTRQLTAALASTGLNVPLNFTPRSGLQVQSTNANNSNNSNNNNLNNNGLNNGLGSNGTPSSTSSTTGTAIPLNNLGHLSTADFSMTLPSALLQAALSDTKTRVLQAPQLRTVDGVKAELKIGEREPTATGSFQPGIGGVGINPLVNTQFNYIDVGVNVSMQAHVHDNGDVSIHIDLDISTVSGFTNIGGIQQPIIGQRKVTHDIRMHEGEVNLLGGLINQSDNKQLTGIPGLNSIPLLRRLFSGESVDRERDELMIVLIPHIIRQPDIGPGNLRGIAVGNQTAIKLNYAPKPSDVVSGPQAAAALQPGAAGTPAPAPAMPAVTTPVATPQATTPPVAPPATVPPAGPPATAPPMTVPGAPPPPATEPATTPATTPPAGTARVLFSPPVVQTSAGSPVSISVMLSGGTDVASAPMQISFDPKVLRLNDIVRGDFLSSDGQQPVFTKNIMNDSGTATVQLSRQPGTPGVNGSGVLVTLNFQAVGRGTTPVFIPNLMVRNSQGQPVADGSPRMTVSVQ